MTKFCNDKVLIFSKKTSNFFATVNLLQDIVVLDKFCIENTWTDLMTRNALKVWDLFFVPFFSLILFPFFLEEKKRNQDVHMMMSEN